VHRHKHI